MLPSPAVSEFKARLRAVLAPIAERARSAEELRQVPTENIQLLRNATFFRALQPAAYGGLELTVSDYADSIVELASACASTAWACALLANHAHGVALFSREAQEEVWGEDPDMLVSSSVAPLGKWEAAEGGIRLSGRFSWSSGCDHAGWAVLGYMGKNSLGQPGPCFALVPRRDFEIFDDWDTAALRGTGSKTLVVDGAFVPDHRSESLFALNFGLSRGFRSNPAKLFYLPFSPIFSLGFAAVAVGIARRACDVFAAKTAERVRAYTGAKAAESIPAQVRLAESTNQTTCALELLRLDWREMDARAAEEKVPAAEDVLRWRTHQAYAAKLAIEAVDRLMAAAGGSAWFHKHELQRLFRDVHITGAHAQTDWDIAAQTFGRHLLGLPADAKLY